MHITLISVKYFSNLCLQSGNSNLNENNTKNFYLLTAKPIL